ncbi:hypothetical protein [Microbacterium aurum]
MQAAVFAALLSVLCVGCAPEPDDSPNYLSDDGARRLSSALTSGDESQFSEVVLDGGEIADGALVELSELDIALDLETFSAQDEVAQVHATATDPDGQSRRWIIWLVWGESRWKVAHTEEVQ